MANKKTKRPVGAMNGSLISKPLRRCFPVFLLPTLIAFCIGFVWPFAQGIYLSFCKLTITKDAKFVGLSNYINALKEWTNAKNNPSEHGLVYSIVKALVEKDNPNRKTFLKALAEEEKDGSIVYSDMEYNALKESKRREMVGHKRGIPLLINRNPTINYGSILQMFCVGINDNYTMSMPLQVLPLLAADFDGDTLNILYIHNKNYFEAANRVLNPRNAMYISKNDGTFNNLVNHKKDLIINLNGILQLSRKNYSQDQLNRIRLAKTLE